MGASVCVCVLGKTPSGDVNNVKLGSVNEILIEKVSGAGFNDAGFSE